MARLLQRVQTAVADRWSFVPHPRLYRVRRYRPSVLDGMLRWGVFGWAMSLIWGSVALGVLILIITLIG